MKKILGIFVLSVLLAIAAGVFNGLAFDAHDTTTYIVVPWTDITNLIDSVAESNTGTVRRSTNDLAVLKFIRYKAPGAPMPTFFSNDIVMTAAELERNYQFAGYSHSYTQTPVILRPYTQYTFSAILDELTNSWWIIEPSTN